MADTLRKARLDDVARTLFRAHYNGETFTLSADQTQQEFCAELSRMNDAIADISRKRNEQKAAHSTERSPVVSNRT